MSEKTFDFGTERVAALFRQIFFPTVLGMLSMSAVTTIDGIFVGHGVGSDGIAAVNICVPLIMVITGVGLMLGVGCSVTASIHLAKGKIRAARASVAQAMITATAVGVAVVAAIMLQPDGLGRLLGSSESLLPMVRDYLLWFAVSLLAELWLAVAQFALRLDGAPKLAMWCNVVSAAVNVVLDWLFIFPLGWGVMGAALATTIACMMGAGMAVAYLLCFAKTLRIDLSQIRLNRKGFSFYRHETSRQCRVGASALLGEGTMAMLMFMGNNVFMRRLGDDGVGAFGISCYYLPFVFMIGNAIAQSAQPIISYNFGAGSFARVRSAMRISLLAALLCGAVSTAAFTLAPRLLVSLFISPANPAAQIAIAGFPYYSVGFVFFIVNLATIGYFQSVERIRPATAFALLRGAAFLIPSFLLLPSVLDVKGIWLAMPLSEIATTLCLVCYLGWKRRNRLASVEGTEKGAKSGFHPSKRLK